MKHAYLEGVADKPFVTLADLAISTGLPIKWLKAEAEAGRIPFLLVGKRKVFNPARVERALAERSANDTSSGGDRSLAAAKPSDPRGPLNV